MMKSESQLNAVFIALANTQRRVIVRHLALQPATISELARFYSFSLPAIHRHIKILEKAKLVRRKKSGRLNFLAFDRTALQDLNDWLKQYNLHWGSNRETLENYILQLKQKSINKRNK